MQRKLQQEPLAGPKRTQPYAGLALFSYGFRPFFLGAALWAVLSLALWLASLAGVVQLAEGYGALAWHAHEMLFGYASAVVAGFLLTAVPNWTGHLPVSGPRLMLLFLLWCAGRIAFLMTGVTGPLPAIMIDSLFLPCLLFTMGREIVAGRNWRNLKPLVLVGLLAAADIGFHAEVLLTGAPNVTSRVGVAALIGLIMLIGGRIIPSFTHSFLSRASTPHLPANFGFADKVALMVSGVALLAWIAVPASTATGIFFVLAAMVQALRLWRWKGSYTWREPLVLILHLGYAFVPLGFLLGAIAILQPGTLAGTAALHAWTVGAVGTMTLAVMTRATRGHTGHDLSASRLTFVIYATILAAAFLRIFAGFFPEFYMILIEIAGVAWIAAFTLFLVEYAPMLLSPRIERGGTG
jgi:uncharacterized protein involved in response to NO